jgi:CDP-diacylglycerol--glycerol-3-phosphate 3-phosphatidyltransferase
MKHVPNILTISRIVLTPIFLVLFLRGTLLGLTAGLVLFIFLAISDWLDGHLARQYGVGSRLGQFLDPLADKVLVLGAFFALLFLPPATGGQLLHTSWWWVAVGLIAFRDVAVTLLRSWAERRGRSIQTRNAAKIKTAVQLTFLITLQVFLIVAQLAPMTGWVGDVGRIAAAIVYGPAPDILLVATTLLTLWTGALYFRTSEVAEAPPPPAPASHPAPRSPAPPV